MLFSVIFQVCASLIKQRGKRTMYRQEMPYALSPWRLSIQIARLETKWLQKNSPGICRWLIQLAILYLIILSVEDDIMCSYIMIGGILLVSNIPSLLKSIQTKRKENYHEHLYWKHFSRREEVKLKVLFRICVKQNMLLLLAVYSYYLISQVCSSLIKQRVKISFVIFCKLCGVVKFYVSSSTLVYIILVYLVLVFDWKAVYILSSALARLCFCIIFILCSNWSVVLWHISWCKCFRYLCYNYKVFHLGQLHSTEVNK